MQPMTILEKVKEFLVRLVKDEAFINQLHACAVEQTQKVLQDAGYTFTKEEFETAAIQLLDLKERNEFHELTEAELVGAIGGLVSASPSPQPLYGAVVGPPVKHPIPPFPWRPPIQVQPLYGVVVTSTSSP